MIEAASAHVTSGIPYRSDPPSGQVLGGDASRPSSVIRLTPGDFDVLATIRRRQDKGGLNPGQVLESVLITSGGLTKRIDRLEKAGLIERHPDPGDRRGTLLRLTPAGRKRIDQAISSLLEMEHEKVTAVLGDRRVVESANLLRRLTASLDT